MLRRHVPARAYRALTFAHGKTEPAMRRLNPVYLSPVAYAPPCIPTTTCCVRGVVTHPAAHCTAGVQQQAPPSLVALRRERATAHDLGGGAMKPSGASVGGPITSTKTISSSTVPSVDT